MATKRKASPSTSWAPFGKRFAFSTADGNLPARGAPPAAFREIQPEASPSVPSTLTRAALGSCSQDEAQANVDIGPVSLALRWLTLRGGDSLGDEASGNNPKKAESKGVPGGQDDTAMDEDEKPGGGKQGNAEAAGNAGNAGEDDMDVESVSSDWVPWMERHGDGSFEDYRSELDAIADYNTWIREKRKLHQLLWMRGRHPLFPSTWEYNFLMWGLPQKLYRERGSRKRVAISHKGNEFRAAKAFEPLMDLSIKVADYDWAEKPDTAKKVIVSTIQRYINWALEDAGVAAKQVQPVVKVYHYSSHFGLPSSPVPESLPEADDETDGGDVGEADDQDTEDVKDDEVGEVDQDEGGQDEDGQDEGGWDKDGHDGEAQDEEAQDEEAQDEEAQDEAQDLEEEQQLLNIQDDIEVRMQKLAQQHRDKLADATSPTGWSPYQPPVLFGYAVIHNVVLIVCLDGSDPTARVSVLEKLSLASPDQWLWNAITLAIPIHFARDHLYEIRSHLEDKEKDPRDLEDPDA